MKKKKFHIKYVLINWVKKERKTRHILQNPTGNKAKVMDGINIHRSLSALFVAEACKAKKKENSPTFGMHSII